MEAPKTSSRKRKQSSNSNPFTGILTRHKSQKFFFHHNRSGKSRKSRSFPSSFSNPNLPNNQEFVRDDAGVDGDDDEIYHISIKDLRARRVFSKPPKSEEEIGKNVNPKVDSELIESKMVENDVQFAKNDVVGENPNLSVMEKGENPNLLDSEKCVDLKVGPSEGNPNLSMVEKCVDSSTDIKSECLNGANPNLSIEGSGAKIDISTNLSIKGSGSKIDLSGNDTKEIDGGNPNLKIEGFSAKDDMSPNLSGKNLKGFNGEHCEEEVVLTTPPDAVVLVRNADSRSPPKRISPNKGGIAEGKKSFSNPKKNLVLNPCSRMKVFKAPNSFSYRRLLPFLMDIAKDTPSVPKVNQRIKIEADFEENPVVFPTQEGVVDRPEVDEKPQDSAVACETQESNNVSKEGELPLDSTTIDFNAQQAAPCTPINCPLENNQEKPLSDEQIGTPVFDYSKSGGESPDRKVSSDNVGNLGDITPIARFEPAALLQSPERTPEPSKEDGTLETPSHLSLDAEKECSTALVEFKPEASSISVLHTPRVEAVVSTDEKGFGLANGILKKNPRGCRGICNCLNCASFRLNAEKAFEFSRNQFFDAEELVTDLMKELSNLRCMLTKSVTGADDNVTMPVDQVQELCRRASNVEDTARSRLSQMNENIHFHCRNKPLQRPQVAFSSSIPEKAKERTNVSRQSENFIEDLATLEYSMSLIFSVD